MILVEATTQIELVGGDPWWQQNVGSLILAIAAISAAAIAAYVSIHNQRQQLGHDRYLRNQDHIRNTIDQALIAVNDARTVMDHYTVNIETAEENRLTDQEVLPEMQTQLEELRESALSELHSLLAVQVRLEARLGESSPISISHKKVARAYSDLVIKGLDGVHLLREESVREEDAEREAVAEEAFKDFKNACHEWFNREP